MSEVQTPINTARESGDVADSGNVKVKVLFLFKNLNEHYG